MAKPIILDNRARAGLASLETFITEWERAHSDRFPDVMDHLARALDVADEHRFLWLAGVHHDTR